MARLVVNPGSPAAWEAQLKPGDNYLGRGFANDVKFDDPSISTSHCQIILTDHLAVIKDLGSTNGTYLNRAPVREAELQSGQTIHLGGVEMTFHADGPGEPSAEVAASPSAGAVPAARAARTTVRVATVPPLRPAAAVAPGVAPAAAHASIPAAQGGPCKFHARTIGRFLCPHCGHFFCDMCVNTRPVEGVMRHFCRQCGGECAPVQVPVRRAARPAGFFAQIPGAFLYPFKGMGLVILIFGTLFFAAAGFASTFSLYLQVIIVGYLFAYLQNIIQSTAAGDQASPSLPDVTNFLQDLLIPFLQLIGIMLVCFGPAILLGWVAVAYEQPMAGLGIIPAAIFGCVYFPMAFLAVVMMDTIAAVNPLLVIPSIFRVPLHYLVTVLLLGAIFGLRLLSEFLLALFFDTSLATNSMQDLLLMFAATAFSKLVGLYLLTANARILGLLYVNKKEELGWFSS